MFFILRAERRRSPGRSGRWRVGRTRAGIRAPLEDLRGYSRAAAAVAAVSAVGRRGGIARRIANATRLGNIEENE